MDLVRRLACFLYAWLDLVIRRLLFEWMECCIGLFFAPPWWRSALMVTTRTTASGFSPEEAHLMLKNFSAPRSAPNPASVMT